MTTSRELLRLDALHEYGVLGEQTAASPARSGPGNWVIAERNGGRIRADGTPGGAAIVFPLPDA